MVIDLVLPIRGASVFAPVFLVVSGAGVINNAVGADAQQGAIAI
ncbi:hypothetical protein [Nocardiopsis trehalosi]|nr:hypothetical protein [Nocardiopsis trehalosi]